MPGYVSSSNEASFDFDIELAPPGTESGDEDLQRDVGFRPLADGARRFSRRMESFHRARAHPANHQSLLARFRAAHRAHAAAGPQGRLPGACFERHTQWPRISVFRSFRRREDHDGQTGSSGRRIAYRRDFLCDRGRTAGISRWARRFSASLPASEKTCARPSNAVYLLAKGPENKIEPVAGADAVRGLLGNILFFARDPEFVKLVFDAAFDFVSRVPVRRLTFVPDARVWELIV